MSMGEFYATSQGWANTYDTWGDGCATPYKSYERKLYLPKTYSKKELMEEIEGYRKAEGYEELCWKSKTENGLLEVPISKMKTSHLLNCTNLIKNKIGIGYGRYVMYIRMLDELMRRNVDIKEYLNEVE